MKTNHQRGFRARRHPKAFEIRAKCYGGKLKLSDRVVGACGTGGDSTCGKHGIAQKRRGAKKFTHSRTRFRENAALREIVKNL